MENIFKGLEAVDGVIEIEMLKQQGTIEPYGEFKMTKGNFTQEFSYWAKVEEKAIKGYYYIEDSEYTQKKCTLGELPIDNIALFKKSLTDSGLTTIANKIGFSHEEIQDALRISVANNKYVLFSLGKKAKDWSFLSAEEQISISLNYVITNYETVRDWDKKQFNLNTLNEEGEIIPNAIPTIKMLRDYRETLTKL